MSSLKVHGKGIVSADPSNNGKQFSLKVRVPYSLRMKDSISGKMQTVSGTWFLNGWVGEKNPYTGQPVDSILQYIKVGSVIEFEGSLSQIKKDDGKYSTGINLVAIDFAGINTKRQDQVQSENSSVIKPVKTVEEVSPTLLTDFSDINMELGELDFNSDLL